VEEVTAAQYALVAFSAVLAGTIGGVAGYGTGLLMPLVLAPIIGAEAVVPVIGLSALFTNGSRIAAFWPAIDRRRAALVGCAALPTCILGAYGYTLLTGRGASILIGAVLIGMVPARRLVQRARRVLPDSGVATAGLFYGVLVGGTAGSGVMLLAILMAAGLGGRAVVATDAVVSLALGIVKTGTFATLGALPASSWIMAVLVGLCASPGAFIAKRLTDALPIRIHNAILDGAILIGGAILIAQGWAAGS
jgi:uncharacterized membrane protein YfcA